MSIPEIRRRLRAREFTGLFIEELGWDHVSRSSITVFAAGTEYELHPIAQKREAVVCVLDGIIPERAVRALIERAVSKVHFEHVLAYVNPATGDQVWQWARQDPGRPVAVREHWLRQGQSGEALAERLAGLTVTLEEEEDLTLTTVTARMRRTFDADRVTRAFYDRFKDEHQAFLAFISGIANVADREWYASLMLNRLMFTYFIQKKGFLDGDLDYLRNRLAATQAQRGPGTFLTFYRQFLKRLFHEGFGRQRAGADRELDELIGRVPYLNGGLFEVHELERRYSDIEVPDEGFSRLFDFFDGYTWHLDERPLRNDREINPDVLGYIFEKYINQREMGAYYTKEDITEYIAASSLVPVLLEGAEQRCAIAFEPEAAFWGLLRENPDRYIPGAVLHGDALPLPSSIAEGVANVGARQRWNEQSDPRWGLPYETWREQVERRVHASQLREALAGGSVNSVPSLVARNLDVSQLVQDAIDNCEGPELLRAFYASLTSLSVLDPACGSGAFLFAALNVLAPFYEACLARMQSFVDEPGPNPPESFADFRTILSHAARHPNLRYFVLKSIMVANLYGVDIMEEAVEICKLRLFLKLVAQVDEVVELEPLPDIDFNIRPGNTLVGYATWEEVHNAVRGRLDYDGTAARVVRRSEVVDAAFHEFQTMQLADAVDGAVLSRAKEKLKDQFADLRAELDGHLASQYGVDVKRADAYASWRASHVPFHWVVEFYRIMRGGGFDVIIGNPPYVEYFKVRRTYTVREYETLPCGNVYAFMLERSLRIARASGVVGMIVPVSLVCTDRMARLRALLVQTCSCVASYDMRPSSLFEGVAQRLCIVLAGPRASGSVLRTGGYRRWAAAERPALIPTTRYVTVEIPRGDAPIPKFGSSIESAIRAKLGSGSIEALCQRGADPIYVHRIVRYFVKGLDFVPLFIDSNGRRGRSEDYKPFSFQSDVQPFMVALLNSSLFYWFWRTHSDGFHCGYGDVFRFPNNRIRAGAGKEFAELAGRLMDDLRATSAERTISTRGGPIVYQEFYPKSTKPLLDEIDTALAEHFYLDSAELDFIINYDMKYRIGSDEEGLALD